MSKQKQGTPRVPAPSRSPETPEGEVDPWGNSFLAGMLGLGAKAAGAGGGGPRAPRGGPGLKAAPPNGNPSARPQNPFEATQGGMYKGAEHASIWDFIEGDSKKKVGGGTTLKGSIKDQKGGLEIGKKLGGKNHGSMKVGGNPFTGKGSFGFGYTRKNKNGPDLGGSLTLDQYGNPKFGLKLGKQDVGLKFGDETELSFDGSLGNLDVGASLTNEKTEHGSKNGAALELGYGGFQLGLAHQAENWANRDRNSVHEGFLTGGRRIDAAGGEEGFSSDRSASLSYRALAGIQSGSGEGFDEYAEAGVTPGLWESSKGQSEALYAQLKKKGLSNLTLSDIAQGNLLSTGHDRMDYDASGWHLGFLSSEERDVRSSSSQSSLYKDEGVTRGQNVANDSKSSIEVDQSALGGTDRSSSYKSKTRTVSFSAAPGTPGEQALLDMTKTGLLPGALEYADQKMPILGALYRRQKDEIQRLVDSPKQTSMASLTGMPQPSPQDLLRPARKRLAETVDRINALYEPTLSVGKTSIEGLQVAMVQKAEQSGWEELRDGKKWGSHSRDVRTDYLDEEGEHEARFEYGRRDFWSQYDDEQIDVVSDSDERGGLEVGTVSKLEKGHKSMFARGLSDMPAFLAEKAAQMGFESVRSKFALDQSQLSLIGADLRSQKGLWLQMSTDVVDYWQTRASLLGGDRALAAQRSTEGSFMHYLKVPSPYGKLDMGWLSGVMGRDTEASLATQFMTVASPESFLALPVSLQRTYVATVIQHSSRSKSNPFDAIAAISLMEDDVERAAAYKHLVVAAKASLATGNEGNQDVAVVFDQFRKGLGDETNAMIEGTTKIELTSDTLDKTRGMSEQDLLVELHLSAISPARFLAALRVAQERGNVPRWIDRARPDPVKVAKGLLRSGTSEQLEWILDITQGTVLATCLRKMSPKGEITEEAIERFGSGTDAQTKTYALTARLHALVDLDVAEAGVKGRGDGPYDDYADSHHERLEELRLLIRDLGQEDPEGLDLALGDGHITAVDLYNTFHDTRMRGHYGVEERWAQMQEQIEDLKRYDKLDGKGMDVLEASTNGDAMSEFADASELAYLAREDFEGMLDYVDRLRAAGGGPKVIERMVVRSYTRIPTLLADAMSTTSPRKMQKRLDGLYRAFRGTCYMQKLLDPAVVDEAIEDLFVGGSSRPIEIGYGLTRCFDLLIDGRSGAQVERLMGDLVTLDDLDALFDLGDSARVRGWYERFPRGRAALERRDGAA